MKSLLKKLKNCKPKKLKPVDEDEGNGSGTKSQSGSDDMVSDD